MKHSVKRVDDLMYVGCEPHWKCVYCGVCIPFHCWDKSEIESMECSVAEDEIRSLKKRKTRVRKE